jgi:thiamine biosynthesis lipoprotein
MTGLPLDHVEQAVVVAPTTADADALATALAAMDAVQGLALVESLAGVEAQVSMTDGQQWQSSGWQDLVARAPVAQMQTVSSAGAVVTPNAANTTRWPSGFQAVLELNIPKLNTPNYRAPYVVVWITDAQKKLVRSLQVWGNDPKWMDTNYVWWRRYGRKLEVDSIAQPSRKAGQYRLVWDGKNDAGEQLPAGEYTIHVEAAREHGDHSYQSFLLKAEPKPSIQQSAAQQELGNLILRFDRVI